MFLADFHIHSKYSRATSKECNPETLDLWSRRKGLDLVGAGDFTHAVWREELREKLVPAEEGLYTLNPTYRIADKSFDGVPTRFIITGEISSIYKANGKVRKVHNLILLPGLAEADALSRRLESLGANLHSDGRPILGLSSHNLLEITLEVCPDAIFIPAHIWTPHFSLFGAFSGFNTIEECFGDLTPHILALETGLSSDPPMNWRLSALDRFTLVSNSDAHSPGNLAREANLFDCKLSYPAIQKALDKKNPGFHGTIEFFPEEGKYHFDGHRTCNVCLAPADTRAYGGVCPKCGCRITVGVLNRVEELADRQDGYSPATAPHYENLVPLQQVIAASFGLSAASKKATQQYNNLLHCMGNELFILRNAPLQEIERYGGPCVAEGIRRVRAGKVERIPGYDGEYGKIKLLDKSEIDRLMGQVWFSGFDHVSGSSMATPTASQPAPETTRASVSNAITTEVTNPYGLNREQWEAASASSGVV
ncbi:MAG: endonuclease Q family protein, partial [Eubacteriales bacterium]